MFKIRLTPAITGICCLLVLSTLIFSCNKVAKTTKFDMEFNGNLTVQDTFQIGLPYDIFTGELATNSQQLFASKNTDNDHIESITLTEFDISVSNPPGEDMSSLDSIEIFLSAPGYAEAKITSKTNIFIYATTIDFSDFLTSDLQIYLTKNTILFRMRVYLDETVPENVQIALHAKFHVDAKEVED